MSREFKLEFYWGHGPVDHLQFFKPITMFGKFEVTSKNF